MVLNGSIRGRVWQMLSCGGYSRNRKVSSDGCEALYAKAGVPFLPAARRFYERCGGLFSDCEIIFETGSDSREFYFYLYPDMGEDAAVELYKAYYDEGTSAGERICGEALAAKAASSPISGYRQGLIPHSGIKQNCYIRRIYGSNLCRNRFCQSLEILIVPDKVSFTIHFRDNTNFTVF